MTKGTGCYTGYCTDHYMGYYSGDRCTDMTLRTGDRSGHSRILYTPPIGSQQKKNMPMYMAAPRDGILALAGFLDESELFEITGNLHGFANAP